MDFLWKPKFILANFLLLLLIKAALAPAWLGVASLTQEPASYSKSDVIYYTNQYRESIGMKPLVESYVLNIAAAQKLQDMLRKQYFAHFSPDGISPWYWFSINKYEYTHAGENLAIGFLDPQSAVAAWINSPAHRRNLANGYYREVGIAVERGKIRDMEGVIVVQFFGAPVVAAPQVADSSEKKGGLSVGFSEIEAKEEITPEPSPSFTPSFLPPTPQLTQPIVPLFIGTSDVSTRTVPQTSAIDTSPKVNRFVRILDSSFIVYAFVVAVLAVAYLVFSGLRRKLALLTAAHIVVFLLSSLIPLSEAFQQGFIF